MEKFAKYAKLGLESELSELRANKRGYENDLKVDKLNEQFIEDQISYYSKEIEEKEMEMKELLELFPYLA